MNTKIEKNWITKSGYEAIVVINDANFESDFCERYWRCGYVGVPESHPFFGLNYNDNIDPELFDTIKDNGIGKRGIIPLFCCKPNNPRLDILFDVHGSLTYSEITNQTSTHPKGTDTPTQWYGFDCHHYRDNIDICTLDYCIKECESLAEQLLFFDKKVEVK